MITLPALVPDGRTRLVIVMVRFVFKVGRFVIIVTWTGRFVGITGAGGGWRRLAKSGFRFTSSS